MFIQQDQRPVFSQRIDPKLIVANTILQLSSQELVQSIEAELLENPALETLEETGCEGTCLDPSICPYCTARAGVRANEERETMDSGDPLADFEGSPGIDIAEADDGFDIVGNLESEITLQQHLCGLLRTAVPEQDHAVGEYLINSLDERGWLCESTLMIACDLNVSESDVCRLLTVIQSFDPPGVGAQNLQECLLLQLKYLLDEEDSTERQLIANATRLLQEQFENVCNSRYIKIARALKLPVDQVRQAIDFIRARLNPFPASQFRSPWTNRPINNKSIVRPDVTIRRAEYGYEIEVPQMETFALNVNPQYREEYLRIKKGDRSHTPDEQKHFIEYVERAERFIQNINQRRITLRQITRCIVDCQTGFLETGSRRFLRPLTRTHIARLLNIHESTVSRATSNKFVQLPNQDVVGFDLFFRSSLSVKDAVETLIQDEDATNPLSDQQIVEQLRERGITIARRTIVKYRDQAKILSSTHRRR